MSASATEAAATPANGTLCPDRLKLYHCTLTHLPKPLFGVSLAHHPSSTATVTHVSSQLPPRKPPGPKDPPHRHVQSASTPTPCPRIVRLEHATLTSTVHASGQKKKSRSRKKFLLGKKRFPSDFKRKHKRVRRNRSRLDLQRKPEKCHDKNDSVEVASCVSLCREAVKGRLATWPSLWQQLILTPVHSALFLKN